MLRFIASSLNCPILVPDALTAVGGVGQCVAHQLLERAGARARAGA